MNKKVSTLVASLLLATGFGVTAQTVPTGDFAKYTTVPTGGVKTLTSGYFQLEVGSGVMGEEVLAVEKKPDGSYLKIVDNTSGAEVRNTLWYASVVGNAEAGYSYQLTNLGTGDVLAVDPRNAVGAEANGAIPDLSSLKTKIGSLVDTWKWVSAPDPVGGFVGDHAASFTAAFGASRDSIVTLAANATVAGDVYVVAVKYALNNVPSSPISNQIKAVPVAPAAFALGANDLNSLLWRKNPSANKAEFRFNPDIQGSSIGNLFTKQEYRAVGAVGYPAAYGVSSNPFSSIDVLDDIFGAEDNLYKAQLLLNFVNALLPAILDEDNTVNASKLANLKTAVSKIAQVADEGSTKDELKGSKLNNAGLSNDEQGNAVKAAVAAYIDASRANQGSPAATDVENAKKIYGAGGIADGVKTWLGEDGFATDKATCEANINAKYVTGHGGLEELKRAVKTAMSSAKTNFDSQSAANGWVSLVAENNSNDSNIKYLCVDNGYVTAVGGDNEQSLGFATKTFADFGYTADKKARLDLNGRYNFQFTYYPEADSIVIRTAGWTKKKSNQEWGDINSGTNTELGSACTKTGSEHNIVKLAYLTDTHSEVVLGSSEIKAGVTPSTINTRISLRKIDDEYVKTTLPSGVYFLSLFSEKAANEEINGKTLVAKFAGSDLDWAAEETSKVFGTVQDFTHMPRTQWVVKQNEGRDGVQTVNIYNREYPDNKAENVQLYRGGNGKVFAVNMGITSTSINLTNDTLSYVKASGETVTDASLGYKALDYDEYVENVFALKYFNGLNAGNFAEVSEDEAMNINPDAKEGMKFVFVPESMTSGAPTKNKYGYQGTIAGVKNLTRIAYYVQVYDPKAEDADKLYLKENGDKGYTLDKKANATAFYFKENNELKEEGKEAVCYYALVNKTITNVAGVKHPSLVLSVETLGAENGIATFAFDDTDNALYRRLGATVTDEFEDMKTGTAKFYMANEPTRFLYENTQNRTADNGTAVAKDSLNFLGVINAADRPAQSAFPIFVDTAYVRGETTMPQYMLAVNAKYVEAGEDYEPCDVCGKTDCEHAKKVTTKAYTAGRYLVSLESDSTVAKGTEPTQYQGAYRLAFVDAKHIEDNLIIASSKYTGTGAASKDTIKLNNNKKPNVATFAFRIVDGSSNADFYMQTANSAGEKRFVRVHNGVPVLVKDMSEAAQFNLAKTDETSTANETIAAEGIKVIAGEGFVTVKGAAGKKVVIANVLGQTVANTVASSDEAQIAAPAGVVIVAVEGEAAVKAIVK